MSNRRASVMLVLTYVGIFVCIGVMLFKEVDANSAIGGALLFLLGKLSGNWETAFNYEFGTSKSSKAKDDTIASLTAAAPPPENSATILQENETR